MSKILDKCLKEKILLKPNRFRTKIKPSIQGLSQKPQLMLKYKSNLAITTTLTSLQKFNNNYKKDPVIKNIGNLNHYYKRNNNHIDNQPIIQKYSLKPISHMHLHYHRNLKNILQQSTKIFFKNLI